jgi:hypothetical protein
MFSKLSKAGVGELTFILSVVFMISGFDVDDGQITELANALILLGGWALRIYAQFTRPDLIAGLVRK